jgi:hypothetical protein
MSSPSDYTDPSPAGGYWGSARQEEEGCKPQQIEQLSQDRCQPGSAFLHDEAELAQQKQPPAG